MRRKFLSVLLAMAIVLTMVPVTALAEGELTFALTNSSATLKAGDNPGTAELTINGSVTDGQKLAATNAVTFSLKNSENEEQAGKITEGTDTNAVKIDGTALSGKATLDYSDLAAGSYAATVTVNVTDSDGTNATVLTGVATITIEEADDPTPTTFGVSGTVRAGSGLTLSDLSGITVTLYAKDDTETSLGTGTTAADGKYTIGNASAVKVEAGSYVVVVAANNTAGYDESTADVTVSNADVTNADITLVAATPEEPDTFTVGGKVSKGNTSVASLADITVTLYIVEDGEQGASKGTATTDAQGAYTISDVEAGSYVAVVAASKGNYKEAKANVTVGTENVTNANITLAAPALTKIEVTGPSKTAYNEGDDFDDTGMTVTATYDDAGTKAVTNYTVSPTKMAANTTAVTVSYTENGVTKTADVAVTVTANLKGTVAITSDNAIATPRIGDMLTATLTTTQETPGTLTYKWYRGTTEISGATGQTYTLTTADFGKTITAEVSAANYAGSVKSTATAAVAKKANSAVPTGMKAEDANITFNKITLTAPTDPSGVAFEYSKDDGATWQTSLTFSQLTPDTEYSFVARVQETADTEAGAKSAAVTAKTAALTGSEPMLTGEVTITGFTGTPTIDDVLTADTSGVASSDGATTPFSNKTYQWYRGTTAIPGANASTYTLVAADYNQTIKVVVGSDDHSNTRESAATAAVQKKDAGAATAVVEGGVDKTATSLTVTSPDETYEYACILATADASTITTWKPGTGAVAFTGLTASTEYKIYARIAETDTTKASAPAASAAIMTSAAALAFGAASYSIPSTRVNTAITTVTVSATGGTAPYTYELVDAPDWLSIDASTGAITGTPTATAGATTATVKVTDNASATTTATLNIGAVTSGGGGSSSGGSGGGGSTSSTVTVPVSGDDNKVEVSAKVSGSTATIDKIDGLDKVLDSDADTGVVEIDLTALKKDIDTVSISASSIEDIAKAAADSDNDVDGLAVKLDSGTVEFDADALEAIVDQATSSSIQLVLEKTNSSDLNSSQRDAVKDMDIHGHFDLTLTGGKVITDFKGGRVSVRIPFTVPSGKDAANFVVIYVANDGTVEEMRTSCSGGYISFTTDHFSKYLIAYKDSEPVEPAENTPVTADCDGGSSCPAHKFTDVDTSLWYHKAVDYVITNGLMSGVGENSFSPNANLSRAMLAQILYNQAGRPAVTGSSDFNDVAEGMWYTNAIVWAAENSVVSGLGNGKFGPNDNITREQLAVMLYRYAGSPAADGSLSGFADADKASGYAQNALVWATDNGVMSGKGGGMLDPQGLATRAEVAQMLYNYLNK